MQYRKKADGPMVVAGRLYDGPAGAIIPNVHGWPNPLHLEAVDEEARRVETYYAQHRENAALRPSPWNEFSGALHLPDLPAPAPGPGRPRPVHGHTPPAFEAHGGDLGEHVYTRDPSAAKYRRHADEIGQ